MLQSFWRAVKSYRSGACWNIFPRFTLVIVTTDPGVILLYAASAIFLSLNSFVWMNCRCPLSLFSTICNCQYGVETKLRFSLKRAHIMARVGVCTRPMELFTEPEAAANARLAFMPTSQSAFALLSAAAYRLSYPVPSLRLAIPSRMASSVSEEIHNRLNGLVQPK